MNSSLVSYIQLSPNNSGRRTAKVDTITPHCVVGQCTVQSLGNWFAKKTTKASSNYGIGKDGKVGLYVNEDCRSWCSSNASNDNRAVTIECASDAKAPYAFNDCVYNKLIDLCVDICQRYGKKKLLWFGDKKITLSHVIKEDEMVITVHRWFAAKACPGDWLMLRMKDLADTVTKRLGGETVQPKIEQPVVDAEKTIWDFLYSSIGNAYGVAGLMGNLYAESGLKPNNLQNYYNTKLGMTDDQYTQSVDNGTYKNFITDKAGYGLAQWTFWSRKQSLYEYVKQCGTSIGNLNTQLEYLIREIQGYKVVWNTLKTATSVKQASDIVLTQYEKPADQSATMKAKRAGYGETYYSKYTKNVLNNSTYCVIIKASLLNVRTGPGINYQIIGDIKKGKTVIITEEKNGWGKVQNFKNGWVKLSYTERT